MFRNSVTICSDLTGKSTKTNFTKFSEIVLYLSLSNLEEMSPEMTNQVPWSHRFSPCYGFNTEWLLPDFKIWTVKHFFKGENNKCKNITGILLECWLPACVVQHFNWSKTFIIASSPEQMAKLATEYFPRFKHWQENYQKITFGLCFRTWDKTHTACFRWPAQVLLVSVRRCCQ